MSAALPCAWTATVEQLAPDGSVVKKLGSVEGEATRGWEIDNLTARHGLKPDHDEYRVTVRRKK